MKRIIVAAAALFLTVGAAGVAHAGGKGNHAKLSFPMKGDDFQKHIDAKVVKMRERLEKRIAHKQLSANDAKELRAKFDAGVAKLSAATKQATADGTVTEDEAKQVRTVAKEMRGHRGDKKA